MDIRQIRYITFQ